jgi:hypothetical protein
VFGSWPSEEYGCNLVHYSKGERRERDKEVKGIKERNKWRDENTKEIISH